MYIGMYVYQVYMYVCRCAHLYTFGGGGPQRPPEDFLHHIWQEAGCDQQDDAEPGRTAGQHLHEHIVHPLVVEEGPGTQERGVDNIYSYALLMLCSVHVQLCIS